MIHVSFSAYITFHTHLGPNSILCIMFCLSAQLDFILSMYTTTQSSTPNRSFNLSPPIPPFPGLTTYILQCCFPAPDLPTVLTQSCIAHLSFPVSRCQWSRVTYSLCCAVWLSDTKKVGLLLKSTHCLGPLVVINEVDTFFCAFRSQLNKAPFESSSLCSLSRCYRHTLVKNREERRVLFLRYSSLVKKDKLLHI